MPIGAAGSSRKASPTFCNRVIDRNEDHAHLQLERLAPALRLAGEAVRKGDIKAISSLIKVIDRIDRHQVKFVSKYVYGEEEREKLLDKLNRAADNLKDDPPQDAPAPAATNGEGSQGDGEKKTSADGWLPASP